MMSRNDDDDAAGPDTSGDTGHEDSTNIVKRLRDNQPLSDSHTVRDERMGERRQYGMHDAGSVSADDEPSATRDSDD